MVEDPEITRLRAALRASTERERALRSRLSVAEASLRSRNRARSAPTRGPTVRVFVATAQQPEEATRARSAPGHRAASRGGTTPRSSAFFWRQEAATAKQSVDAWKAKYRAMEERAVAAEKQLRASKAQQRVVRRQRDALARARNEETTARVEAENRCNAELKRASRAEEAAATARDAAERAGTELASIQSLLGQWRGEWSALEAEVIYMRQFRRVTCDWEDSAARVSLADALVADAKRGASSPISPEQQLIDAATLLVQGVQMEQTRVGAASRRVESLEEGILPLVREGRLKEAQSRVEAALRRECDAASDRPTDEHRGPVEPEVRREGDDDGAQENPVSPSVPERYETLRRMYKRMYAQ